MGLDLCDRLVVLLRFDERRMSFWNRNYRDTGSDEADFDSIPRRPHRPWRAEPIPLV